MNTAYNTTTTVQESRNRYNELLQAALKRINDRKRSKTAQESEEVTTTEPTATTPAQQSEPVATPENVTTEPTEASKPEQVTTTRKTTTTRRTSTASPKPLGRDIYHIFCEKQSRWAIMFDKSVYHDPEGYAVLSDNVILIESKLDYKEEHSGKLIQEDGTESKNDTQQLSKYKEICRPTGNKYATTPKEIEEQIKAIQDEEKRTTLCELFGKDMTPEEVKEELKYNKEARAHANAKANPKFVKLLFPTGDYMFLHLKQLKRGLSVAKKLGTNCISKPNNILQFTGEAGRIIVAGCIISPEDESAIAHLTIDLTGATPAPADTTAIEEAVPATAPQATEEDTTTAPEVVTEEATAETPVQEPEEVTTEEGPELTVEQEDDNAPVLLDLIKRYGNVGADYLETLDYNQATEQVYSTKRGNSTKVTERYYTIDDRTIYGLYRRYNRNGKRARFAVYQDGQMIEARAYGKNNSCYKAEIQYNGGEFVYNVTDGKITGGYYTTADKLTIVRFDDNNRPATPRDLPAPATTSKTTTKEEPATTVQEQPTSEPATVPTPEATTAPEEVQGVTTSKQEGSTPYWLLLDQELREQQEEQEQEQALATPEKSEEEPAPATEATDDSEEVVFLKGAELNKVIEEFADKNGLDLKEQKRYYDFYATSDGYFTKLRKQKPRKDLYIADEGPYYDKYERGEITDKDIFFSQNMRDASFRQQMPLYTPESGKLECGLFVAVCRYETAIQTVPSRPASPRECTVYKAIYELYLSDHRTRLEKYWKRYGDKVCVDTYWADR